MPETTRRSTIAVPDAEIVSDQRLFGRVCDTLGKSDRFAFDAEFIGEDAYHCQVCLIQVATQDRVWLIDPLAGFDVTGFWNLIADPNVEKVVHAGLEDLALSYQYARRPPGNVFDVQIAAGLVTTDYPLSLQRLTRQMIGVRLHKSQTLTDWRRRPLTGQQVRYAVEDVGYILAIHDVLRRRLRTTRRTQWACEEFERLSAEVCAGRNEDRIVARVRGMGSLEGRAAAIARELVAERDALAQQHNRPPRTILKDHLLITIAKHGWTRPAEFNSLRGLTLRGGALRRMIEAVERGRAEPLRDKSEPRVREDDKPDEAVLCKLVNAVLYDHCRANQLAFKLVATNRDIRALVLAHTRGPDAVRPQALQRGWRKRAVGSLIDGLLAGNRSIKVDHDADGFRLQIQ